MTKTVFFFKSLVIGTFQGFIVGAIITGVIWAVLAALR